MDHSGKLLVIIVLNSLSRHRKRQLTVIRNISGFRATTTSTEHWDLHRSACLRGRSNEIPAAESARHVGTY